MDETLTIGCKDRKMPAMDPNPYRAESRPDSPDLPKRPLLHFAAFLAGVLLLGGGIGLITGMALAASDWRLGLAVVLILVGMAVTKIAAAPLRL